MVILQIYYFEELDQANMVARSSMVKGTLIQKAFTGETLRELEKRTSLKLIYYLNHIPHSLRCKILWYAS